MRQAGGRVDGARRALWHLRTGGVRQLRTWARRRRIAAGLPARSGRLDRHGRLTFDPWPLPERAPRRADLRVGVVLDDFSRLAFGFEWEQVLLEPSSWQRVLEDRPVDVLFVESAWAGNGGAWSYHLTGPTAPRPAFVELVAWCREHGVPTVFWNKEDPAHFEDFLDAARLFDHVFTTDSAMVPAYRDRLGHDRVGTLGFAAQPVIHNPVRAHGRGPERDVAFAGMYFAHKYPERREQMDLLLGAAHRVSGRMETGLEIFSRQLGGDERYQFPVPYAEHVVGSLTYEQTLAAYREYKVFLNVNSVVDSPSMCARRVFEISACGTPVVSAPSVAITALFPPNEVFTVSEPDEAEHTLRALVRSPELRDRATHLAQRRIWEEHTYSHRAAQVLAAVGIDDDGLRRPSVTAIVSTNRPHQLDHVLRTLGAQVGVRPQLALLAHGFDPDWSEIRATARDLGIDDLVTLTADASVTLGACLNLLVDAADGDVVAKMDDDDLYGPHYLSDQMYAMDYSGADVVGKQAHYMYLEALDATVLRFAEKEHRFTDFVMGPTIVACRDVARAARFADVARGEDTALLRSADGLGATIYAADRFGFVQVRHDDVAAHTWSASVAELLAGGEVQLFGRADKHAFV
ncbi:glycosyltransferase family protein [Sanguibacter antarcticus]|uniref:glycosyltransferase family protein n=1 Tax=Sanguibacter antarcticus TaxID=372484 RepID=UPI001FE44C0C|nr:glycosyltransferase [Sanguibacter antarcticus]